MDGDGRADIITGAGVGGGPHVQVFSGADRHRIANFFAYESTVRNGIFVAAGDVDGDGRAEVITGPGVGGPAARVFDAATGNLRASFYAFPPVGADGTPWQSGVRVAAAHRTGLAGDVIAVAPGAGTGPAGRPGVKLFTLDGQVLDELLTDTPGFTGGVFVGGD